MMRHALGLALLVVLASASTAQPAHAQDPAQDPGQDLAVELLEQEVSALESRVDNVEDDAVDKGLVLMLFGAFCALWAQNTGRSAWGWFFLGLFFSVITIVVLLYKNSEDIERRAQAV